jgi:hypothetical protein
VRGEETGEDEGYGVLIFDWRRTLEADERREWPGRTESMTLLRENGMVNVRRGEEEEEGGGSRVRDESKLGCLRRTVSMLIPLYLYAIAGSMPGGITAHVPPSSEQEPWRAKIDPPPMATAEVQRCTNLPDGLGRWRAITPPYRNGGSRQARCLPLTAPRYVDLGRTTTAASKMRCRQQLVPNRFSSWPALMAPLAQPRSPSRPMCKEKLCDLCLLP